MSEPAKYRAAVIGCGLIGDGFVKDRASLGVYSHAEAYVVCPATELIALCDLDPAKMDACGDRWNVSARYSSAATLLAEAAPEIVSICTPDETHFDLAMLALEAPATRAILLEKPLATQLKPAVELVARARERGIPLAVNYSRRYASSHVALRAALQEGAIGRCEHITGYYTKGVAHNGTHWFDLLRFLLGEISRVQGFTVRAETVPDPTLDVRLELASGATAYLHGCDAQAFSIFEMDLIGSAGRLRVLDSGHVFETFTAADSPHYTGYRSLQRAGEIAGDFRDTTLHAVADLAACLTGNRPPICSGADALAALAVAFAARESALSGQSVSPAFS